MDISEIRSRFDTEGFLSPVMEEFPATYQSMAPKSFELATNFNLIGQRIAARAPNQITGDGWAYRMLATLLLFRTLQGYQAAILLIQRGLATEARILIRGCFENAFCVAALARDPAKFIQALEDDDKASKKAQAKIIDWSPTLMVNLDQKSKAELRKFVSTVDKDWGKVRQLAIEETAKGTSLAYAYFHYRMLSNDSAHPSLTSLQHHKGPGKSFVNGRASVQRIVETVSLSCGAVASFLDAFTVFVEDTEGKREVDIAVEVANKLFRREKP
jgi:hypothetical protein